MVLGDITNSSHTSRQQLSTDSAATAMKPLNFIVALYPGFQLMDLAGPLDILNIITLPPFNQPLRLTFLASTLDPVSTKPAPLPGANYTYDLTGTIGMPTVNTTFQQHITPDATFASYLTSLESSSLPKTSHPDVLFIPGGLGSRMSRITSTPTATDPANTTTSLNVADLLSWIPLIAPHLATGIMTVCTGSDILARSGVLNARRATTNMMRYGDVAARHPGVKWVRGARWVVSRAGEGNQTTDENNNTNTSTPGSELEVWSSAGISAGMDVTLAFVAEYYGGMEVSRDIARRLEYDWGEHEEGEVHAMYKRYSDM